MKETDADGQVAVVSPSSQLGTYWVYDKYF